MTKFTIEFFTIFLRFYQISDPVGPEFPPHKAMFRVRSAKKLVLHKYDLHNISWQLNFLQFFLRFYQFSDPVEPEFPPHKAIFRARSAKKLVLHK